MQNTFYFLFFDILSFIIFNFSNSLCETVHAFCNFGLVYFKTSFLDVCHKFCPGIEQALVHFSNNCIPVKIIEWIQIWWVRRPMVLQFFMFILVFKLNKKLLKKRSNFIQKIVQIIFTVLLRNIWCVRCGPILLVYPFIGPK